MLRSRHAHTLLIAAALSAAPPAAVAQTPATTSGGEPSSALSLPSRISFQREAFRHRRDVPVPASASREDEPRALWLARLAVEGRRPVRLAWRTDGPGAGDRPADPFSRLSFDAGGTPALLPLFVADPDRWTQVTESLLASSTCPCVGWGVNPGRVPDNRVLLGQVLRVARSAGNVVLSWGASCSAAATDYTVHEGSLGSWYSHQAVACTTGGVTFATVTPAFGGRYFLAVPVTADAEGSYGSNSARQDRPHSVAACRPVAVAQNCP